MTNNVDFNFFDKQTLETWFITRLVLDPTFVNIITKDFDKRWVKSPTKSAIAQLIIAFTNKYKRAISMPELNAVMKSAISKDSHKFNPEETSDLLTDVSQTIQSCKTDMLFSVTGDFVKRQAAWCAIIDNVNDIEKDPDATVDRCLSRLNAVQTMELTPTDFGFDYFNETEYDEHFAALLNPDSKISTGWDTLDLYTHGGFLTEGKSLYLFIAQPGLGKSVFLSNIALNFLKQDKTVAVISLEMSQHIYAQRFDAHISNVNINRLDENEDSVKSRVKGFAKQYPGSRLFIKEYPPRAITTAHIERYITELITIRGVKLDAVIIDYLNLVLPTSNAGDNMYKDGLDVSEKLRAMSYKFGVPVITACQVNSAGINNDKVGMSNISESRGMAHTADFILSLFQTDQDRSNGQLSTRIEKNRLGGEVGKTIPFKLHPETLVLTDIGSSGGYAISKTTSTQATVAATDFLLDDMFNI